MSNFDINPKNPEYLGKLYESNNSITAEILNKASDYFEGQRFKNENELLLFGSLMGESCGLDSPNRNHTLCEMDLKKYIPIEDKFLKADTMLNRIKYIQKHRENKLKP